VNWIFPTEGPEVRILRTLRCRYFRIHEMLEVFAICFNTAVYYMPREGKGGVWPSACLISSSTLIKRYKVKISLLQAMEAHRFARG
jgi:hypothetical protein